MLGIIGAMDEEVARLKEMIDGLQVTDKCGMSFYKGQIEGTDVVVVKCDIDIGDIVLATDTVEHDMDVSALGYEPGVIPDTELSVFKTSDELLKIAQDSVDAANIGVKVFTGRVLSGDQFIWSKDKKKWLVETFGGRCAEMEGAAIGHVAVLNKVPYLVVRAISDKADDSAEMDYPTFAAKAIENSVNMMTEIIKRYEVK